MTTTKQVIKEGDKWIITEDVLEKIECSGDVINDYIKNGYCHLFRMKDDDGNIYYYGYSKEPSVFNPLDDFGKPNDGCTSIEYACNGWKAL